MICKACGTQCRGLYCSHCGAPLAVGVPPVPVAESQAQAVPTPSATTELAQTPPQKENKQKAQRAKRPRVRVRMRQVFFPSLVFFLPLIYLFVDAFVVYSNVLRASAEGGTVLRLLVSRLLDASFNANPVSDIIAATVGGDGSVITLLSVKGILAAPTAHPALLAPAAILAISAVVSALGGILVLFTAGRILSWRPTAVFVIGGGFLASLAPLLADLAFRLYHVANGGMAAADVAIRSFGLSFEVILTCGLSLALMLPAVRAIRRAAGGQGVFVAPPYALLCRRFWAIRLLGALFTLAAIVLPLGGLLIESSVVGKPIYLFLDGVEHASYNASVVARAFFAKDLLATASAVIPLIALLIVPLTLLAVFPALFSLLRFLFTRPIKAALLKRRKKAFLRTGQRLRRIALIAPALFVACGIVAFLLLLLGARAHIAPANVGETLTVIYLLLAYARSIAALHTTGLLVCVLSLVLSNVAGSLGRAFVALSLEKHPKK